MILTINLYNFRYQIYNDVDDVKVSWGRSVYLELVIEFASEKPINCCDGGRGDSIQPHHHFHYENRLTCLQQNLLVRGCY